MSAFWCDWRDLVLERLAQKPAVVPPVPRIEFVRQPLKPRVQRAYLPRPPVPSYPERNREIFRLRSAGKSFAELATTFGITTERARQIYRKQVKIEKTRQSMARLKGIFKQPDRGRVIDMGGQRDQWLVWTPEMQAREFGG